jgi:flagellar assembly protein FliH
MSSKAVLVETPDHVRPFAWRTVALSGETLDRRRAALELRPGMAPDAAQPLPAALAEQEREMEKRVCEARETGYRAGEAAGRTQAEDEVRAGIQRLGESIAGVDEYRGRLYRQTELDAVRLSIAIARRVLRRELTVDPSAIEGLVSAALQRLQTQETCRVKMHPDYIPTLSAAIERMGMSAKVEVVADPAQEPGAAVFEMPRGNLDASIDSQLREIERGLVDRFQRP